MSTAATKPDPLIERLDHALVRAARKRQTLAAVECVLRTTGHQQLADELVGMGAIAVGLGVLESLRSHALVVRSAGYLATATCIESAASAIESASTVRGALRVALECARRGAW